MREAGFHRALRRRASCYRCCRHAKERHVAIVKAARPQAAALARVSERLPRHECRYTQQRKSRQRARDIRRHAPQEKVARRKVELARSSPAGMPRQYAHNEQRAAEKMANMRI